MRNGVSRVVCERSVRIRLLVVAASTGNGCRRIVVVVLRPQQPAVVVRLGAARDAVALRRRLRPVASEERL
eukprot:1747583-Prymnesium_polylepis.1